MPRHVLQITAFAFVALALVIVALNYSVRVGSTAEGSYGVVEHWIFGRSVRSAFTRRLHSEAFNHWDDANKLSAQVAAIIATNGPALVLDPHLSDERARAALLARTAFNSATAIPDAYLAASNPDLPAQYKTHFVEGMRLFAEGLENSDNVRVGEGIDHYNSFLRWIQARDRNDFKPLR